MAKKQQHKVKEVEEVSIQASEVSQDLASPVIEDVKEVSIQASEVSQDLASPVIEDVKEEVKVKAWRLKGNVDCNNKMYLKGLVLWEIPADMPAHLLEEV